MMYDVVYSANARQDIRDIYTYIAFELMEMDVAKRQVNRIVEKICSLTEMPFRHKVYEDEPWHSIEMRYFPVDNYLVFYLPSKNNNVVNILRIMYKGRDITRQLSKSDLI